MENWEKGLKDKGKPPMNQKQKKENTDSTTLFDDTAVAFEQKSDKELFLSYLIFTLTKNPLLVKILSSAAKVALAIGLPIKSLIRATVFKQFCGGESKKEYNRVISQLGQASIGTILDYSVEGSEDENSFEQTKTKLLELIEQSRSNPDIPCTCMKMTGIAPLDVLEKVSAGSTLSLEDQKAWENAKKRLNEICDAAFHSDKPIYVDAEESWIQEAIDRLMEEMMAGYNRDKAIVYTTLQLYRWDRNDYFLKLIEDARTRSYHLGIKIVRGAYLEKENNRAKEREYPTPINPSKEATDREYNKSIEIFMDHMDVVNICVGTHNEESCLLLLKLMKEKNIPNNHPHIYFSQLFGMSDTISFNLSKAGYNVSKYLPFGPVESTLPYLTRRAEENTAIAGQMSKELEIIIKERERRKTAAT